jgi:hypothetical protein
MSGEIIRPLFSLPCTRCHACLPANGA